MPPIEADMVSPDGTWRRDGARWVPVQPQSSPRGRPFLRTWMLVGCATVLVLAVVGIGIGYPAYSFINHVFTGSHRCLPSDFPLYPGATPADFNLGVNGANPGYSCNVVFESTDDVATVTAFYQSKLNTGDWWVTTSDGQAGNLTFQFVGGAQPFGTVNVTAGKTHTEITVDLFTVTCLPRGFPRYPGSGFAGQSYDQNATGDCKVALVSNDGVATVAAFYQHNLNTLGFGTLGWEITSSSGGEIQFRHRNGKRYDAGGTMTIAASGNQTMVNIDTRG